MSETGPVLYDPVELRRRIVVCFSVGELRALAESLGVGGIAWERGIHEAAREVVRQAERYAGLPALVARLREERPLVEWPEPTAGSVATEAPAPGHDGGRAPIPPGHDGVDAPALAPPDALGFPALSASPGAFGGVPGPAVPALLDPYAPLAGAPAIRVPASAPAASAWPGVTAVEQAPARSGGVDPRIFVAVAGLMVLAAVIAYLAGRASTVPPATEAAAVASGQPPPPASSARGDGPAAFAAGALARSFANMARVCELPLGAGANELVFRRVFERCGPGAPPPRSYLPPPLPTAPAATGADPEPTDPPSPRGKRSGARGGDPAASGAAPAAKGCMGTCDAQHAACRSHCGAEPTESSAYDGFQRCLGRCLSEGSRCRLTCR